MATIKTYSDLQQSKKLAEILPLESADQTWARIAIAGANLDVPEELQYRHNGDMPFRYYSGIGTPCWSLSALLGVLPKGTNISTPKPINALSYCCWNQYNEIYADNPVDACYEMIIKLHEQNLL